MKITDGGPIYTETYQGELLVEPWNAVSSLIYLIPAIYWFIKIRRSPERHSVLTLAVILLFAGGIGSTLFHGLRVHSIFLLLDVLPIQLLTLMIIVFFWFKVLRSVWLILVVTLLAIGSRLFIFAAFEATTAINLSYLLNGIFLFVPIFIHLKLTGFRHWKIIFVSVVLFVVSLVFRQIDPYSGEVLKMGTHWLWHVFSAAGSGFLGSYFYKENY